MGPKKKKTKKKAQEEEQEALRLAQLAEEERQRQKVARIKEIREIEAQAILREKQETNEHDLRLAILTKNLELFEKIKTEFINDKIRQRELDEWKRYLLCDRLPNPSIASSMNAHLSYWSNLKETENMDNVLQWVEKFIVLLTKIDSLIEEPLNTSQITIENWKEVRQSYRSEIFRKFDQATFQIIREIETRMNRVDYWTVDYKRFTKNVKIYMWAWLKFPISDINKRNPPTVDFPEIGIMVRLPFPYDRKFVVIRVIHVSFDPLSDSSRTWQQPPTNQEGTLIDIVDFWHQKQMEIQKLKWQEEAILLEIEKKLLKEMKNELIKPEKHTDKKKGKRKKKADKGRRKHREKTDKEKRKKMTTDETNEEETEDGNNDGTLTVTSSTELVNKRVSKEIKFLELQKKKDKTDDNDVESADKSIRNAESDESDKEFKAVILNCFFHVEYDSEEENLDLDTSEILRGLVKHGDPKVVKMSLVSLNASEKIKSSICAYFRRVMFIESKKVERKSKTSSVLPDTRETTVLKLLRETLAYSIKTHEINLRKYTILGGVFYLDLINQIDQRFPLKDGSSIQIQYGNYEIERDGFVYIYEPPKIVETNEDEEEKPPPDDNIDKLIHVEISLPETILWFEAPAPVLWHSDEKIWSNQHVYDVRFNEEKQIISLKVGRTLPIGLSAVRHNNLPFQTWELRPGIAGSNTVYFSLTASTVILEFAIRDDKVSLESLQNSTGSALEPILGKFFTIYELINIMKKTGIDVFPGNDAFLYIEGHSLKDYIVEEHVYMCMAMFSQFFQFSWSRWNMLAGWGTLVYQIRQVYAKKHLPNYCMVMSNIYRTTIVACSEVSPAFSEESIPDIGFNPDLYSLLKSVCSKKIKELIGHVETNLVYTVYDFIRKTKFFSYS